MISLLQRGCYVSGILLVLWLMTGSLLAAPLSESVTISSSTLLPGQPWMLNGSAPGVHSVQVWLFGSDMVWFTVQPVEPDNTYKVTLPPDLTVNLTPGTYHIVLQFPHPGSTFDVQVENDRVLDRKKPVSQQCLFSVAPGSTLPVPVSPFAYTTFMNVLDDPEVNDTYLETQVYLRDIPLHNVSVHNPALTIFPISDQSVGNHVVINGTTTLPVGEELLVEAGPSEFLPRPKIPAGYLDGISGTVRIVAGKNDTNLWSFPVDTDHWLAEEYLVRVTAINEDATATTIFRLYDGSIRIDPVGNSTAGDTLLVTGTSTAEHNMPIFVKLVYQPVIREKSVPLLPSAPCNGHAGRIFPVNRSAGKWWSADIDTTGCSPGSYRVDVFAESGEVQEDFSYVELLPLVDRRVETSNTSIVKDGPTTVSEVAATESQPLPVEIVLVALVCTCIIVTLKRRK